MFEGYNAQVFLPHVSVEDNREVALREIRFLKPSHWPWGGGTRITISLYTSTAFEFATKLFDHLKFTRSFPSRILKSTNYFGTAPQNDSSDLSAEETYIGSLILRNLQLLQFNSHELSEIVCTRTETNGEIELSSTGIGGALFPVLALFNHSCDPSIARYALWEFIERAMVYFFLHSIWNVTLWAYVKTFIRYTLDGVLTDFGSATNYRVCQILTLKSPRSPWEYILVRLNVLLSSPRQK